MNKQKAIKKIEKEKSPFNDLEGLTRNLALDDALDIVRKLDEPEKPVVPQFVADWYEDNKADIENSIYQLCVDFYLEYLDEKFDNWFKDSKNKPIKTIMDMGRYSYEIEKEKLYTAKLKSTGEYLHYDTNFKELRHYAVCTDVVNEVEAYHFTEDDLVKYYIWGNNAYEVNEVKQ